MLTTQLKATASLIILFLTVAIAAKAIGSLQPPNPALRGFVEGCEDKPQPCWYGIVLHSTTHQEATPLLEKMGYVFSQVYSGGANNVVEFKHPSRVHCVLHLFTTDDIATNLRLVRCTDVLLGDWLLKYENEELYFNSYDIGGATFETHDRNIQFVVLGKGFFQNIESFMIIPARSGEMPFRWHGMMPNWRYCQVQPKAESYLCTL